MMRYSVHPRSGDLIGNKTANKTTKSSKTSS